MPLRIQSLNPMIKIAPTIYCQNSNHEIFSIAKNPQILLQSWRDLA